jgi:hypothetical protein
MVVPIVNRRPAVSTLSQGILFVWLSVDFRCGQFVARRPLLTALQLAVTSPEIQRFSIDC